MTDQMNIAVRTHNITNSDLLDLSCNADTPLLDGLKFTLAASFVFAGITLVLILAASAALV